MKFSRLVAMLLFWPALGFIAWGEITPSPPDVPLLDVWDKLEHFTAYFGLAAMAAIVLKSPRRLLWAGLGLVLVGGLLEILQAYTGRDPDIWDEVANSLGVLCGIGAGRLFLFLFAARPLVEGGRDE